MLRKVLVFQQSILSQDLSYANTHHHGFRPTTTFRRIPVVSERGESEARMSLGLISGYGSDSGSDQESGEKEEQGYQVGQRPVTLCRALNEIIT